MVALVGLISIAPLNGDLGYEHTSNLLWSKSGRDFIVSLVRALVARSLWKLKHGGLVGASHCSLASA